MARRDVFQAIADPTRREILQLLQGGVLSLNEIAERFPVSRPAVSKHVRILRECGVVEVRQKGRERLCKVKPRALKEVAEWVDQYRQFWNRSLDKLEQELKKNQK